MAGAAEARKRRKEIIKSQRNDGQGEASPEEEAAATAAALAMATADVDVDTSATSQDVTSVAVAIPAGTGTTTADKKPPKKRRMKRDTDDHLDPSISKKTQIRYDPDVPMNKEQLAAWRREARRVRNRESAAASRQRIRDRISELEGEVDEWKGKYNEALARLEALEQRMNVTGGGSAIDAGLSTSV